MKKNSSHLSFTAIDVETANHDLSSICHVGLTIVKDGTIKKTLSQLINPGHDTKFHRIHVGLHGIQKEDVEGKPFFAEIHHYLEQYLSDVVLHHGAFDYNALCKACVLWDKPVPARIWIDSTKIVRRAWPAQCAEGGYGLKNMADHLGLSFKHHDAGHDSRVLSMIILQVCKDTGIDIEGWIEHKEEPLPRKYPSGTPKQNENSREGDPEGKHFGKEVVVFTGGEMERGVIADMAAAQGCAVRSTVSKKTTILVSDVLFGGAIDAIRGKEYMTNKQKRAAALIAEGYPIKIMNEKAFLTFLKG